MASALHFLGWSISCHPAAVVGQARLEVMHGPGLENISLVHQLGHDGSPLKPTQHICAMLDMGMPALDSP